MSNLLEAFVDMSPFDREEKCAKFTIDEPDVPFILRNITVPEREYTLSFWAKADTDRSITAARVEKNIGIDWTYHIVTFKAPTKNVEFKFETGGFYYIYHPKLETGNKATDWSPAPEDMATGEDLGNVDDKYDAVDAKVEELRADIQLLDGKIVSTVFDEDGNATSVIQSGKGWTFDLGNVGKTIEDVSKLIGEFEGFDEEDTISSLIRALKDDLSGVSTDVGEIQTNGTSFIQVDRSGEEARIFLGNVTDEGELGKYKLCITQTSIEFYVEEKIPTYISNRGMVTDNIEIDEEFRQNFIEDGEVQGGFVWATRSNGNYGLSWKKGVSE